VLLTKARLRHIVLEEALQCLLEEQLLKEIDLKKLYGKLKEQFPKLKKAAFLAAIAATLAHPVKYPYATLTDPLATKPKPDAHYIYPQPTEEETPSFYPSGEKIEWVDKRPSPPKTKEDILVSVDDFDSPEEEREEAENLKRKARNMR